MPVSVDLSLTNREIELIALSLKEHATHSLGDPLGRADSERLAKSLLDQLKERE